MTSSSGIENFKVHFTQRRHNTVYNDATHSGINNAQQQQKQQRGTIDGGKKSFPEFRSSEEVFRPALKQIARKEYSDHHVERGKKWLPLPESKHEQFKGITKVPERQSGESTIEFVLGKKTKGENA